MLGQGQSGRKPVSWGDDSQDSAAFVARREQIFIHAAQMFCTQGFSATSMTDIAEAVGITKAGLYHFVRNKEELLFTLMSLSMDALERDVIAPTRQIDDPVSRLAAVVRRHLESVVGLVTPVGNPLAIILEEPSGLSPENAANIQDRKGQYYVFVRSTLEEIRARGELADADPRVATFAIFGIILWLARWHRPDGPLTSAAIVDQLTGTALRAVLKPDCIAANGL
jgi:AcrR family transcriptional regulator